MELSQGLIGKQLKVIMKNNTTFEGTCCEYTQAINNEPEVASICIMQEHGDLSSIELYENEIKEIEVIR